MPRSLEEAQSFMDRERLASFATVGLNNKPHVVPVFFTHCSGKIYVQTDRSSIKVHNLSRNSNVALPSMVGTSLHDVDSFRETHWKTSSNSAASIHMDSARFLGLWYFPHSRFWTNLFTSAFS